MPYRIEIDKRAVKFITKQPKPQRERILKAIYKLPEAGDIGDVLGFSLVLKADKEYIVKYDKWWGSDMPFKYNKLFDLLKERGITTYKIRKENIISQAALTKMKNGEGNIDTRTLERLCSYLQCQPGDIMEYTEE